MNIFYMYCMRKRKINKNFLNIFKISYHKLRINLYRRNFRMSTVKLNGFWQILRFPEILLYIYDHIFVELFVLLIVSKETKRFRKGVDNHTSIPHPIHETSILFYFIANKTHQIYSFCQLQFIYKRPNQWYF